MKAQISSLHSARRLVLAGALLGLTTAVLPAQDLSALPDYHPQQAVTGVLRSRSS